MDDIKAKVEAAKAASIDMAVLNTGLKNKALEAMAVAIWEFRETLKETNKRDLREAETLLKEGTINEAMAQRLKLDDTKIGGIVDMVNGVAALEDPVGRTEYAVELDEGLELFRVSSPIGVIGVVFESRPDALPQIASLCLKSGNAVLMKGGIEAKHSNRLLYSIIKEATAREGFREGWIQLLEDREEVAELLKLDEYVDLIVPRGSNSFVRYIQENTRIPVLGHAEGVCHIYIDRSADLGKAVEICYDSKVQYPSVCNAVDTLLVHGELARTFLPMIVDRYDMAGVEVRGCPDAVMILGDRIKEASDTEWGTEYLDYIVSVKILDGLGESIDHINRYSSHHTDAIIAECEEAANEFLGRVDSANVFWNASTRFSDGYRYGLGAEVGISTGKIHARGPTGLEGLTIYKYYLIGKGQTVDAYVGENAKKFTHRPIKKLWNNRVKG
jgi:glutamate-5-semialdehyde dehydrogenase